MVSFRIAPTGTGYVCHLIHIVELGSYVAEICHSPNCGPGSDEYVAFVKHVRTGDPIIGFGSSQFKTVYRRAVSAMKAEQRRPQ